MPETATPCRRLRFDSDMRPDESIPGAIARGVHAHVLFSTRPVLIAADARLKHIGRAQIGNHDELERLAYVARCEPDRFLACAGVRVRREGWSKSTDVSFGKLVLPRAHLELDRRRISPLSLRTADHHRIDWMSLLLPYCPASLERLVDACRACGSTLGWHYSRGIGTCEHCGVEVAPATEPPLPNEIAGDYRFFAALSSPSGTGRADALAVLPPPLREVAPSTIVRLALHMGGLSQEQMVSTTDRLAIRQLDGPLLATIVSTGSAMLRSWPTSLRDWTKAHVDSRSEDHSALRTLRSHLQRLATHGRESPDLVDLVAGALPDLRSHAVHGFSTDQRYYLYKQVQRTLGLDAAQTDALRSWAGPKYRRVDPNTVHRRGRFDADLIDGLAPIFERAVPFKSCTGRFRLPLYGIEQLCDAGLLARIDEPAYVLAKGETSVDGSSEVGLVSALLAARRTDSEPADATSLSMASRRLGGRLKPWASIIRGLLRGAIPFWLRSDGPNTMTIRVRPADLDHFNLVSDPVTASWVGSAISQADAAEVLNIKSTVLRDISSDLGLTFNTSGPALTTPRDAVRAVAADIAWDVEVAWQLGVRFDKVEKILAARGIARRSTGWSRRHLIEDSILPDAGFTLSPSTHAALVRGSSIDEGFAVHDPISA